MFDVCCLGILVADVIAVPVDELPQSGKLKNVERISLDVGGCAANAAIDLKKIGFNPAVIGKVGEDSFGSFIIDDLNKHGVNTNGIVKSISSPTSASIVAVSNSGERSFLHCPGANGDFCEDDIDFSIIEKSKILFIAGSLLMPTLDGTQTGNILKKAKDVGVYTVLDTAWDPTERWMDCIAPCLPYLDLFIPSIEEAQKISGKDNVSEMADVFISRGVPLCVIKQGKKGCFIKKAGEDGFTIGCYDRIKPISTNGAGDAFVAGFLSGILKGWDLSMCGKFANAVGAHCVTEMSTTAGIRSLEDTIMFMEKYEQGIGIV